LIRSDGYIHKYFKNADLLSTIGVLTRVNKRSDKIIIKWAGWLKINLLATSFLHSL